MSLLVLYENRYAFRKFISWFINFTKIHMNVWNIYDSDSVNEKRPSKSELCTLNRRPLYGFPCLQRLSLRDHNKFKLLYGLYVYTEDNP